MELQELRWIVMLAFVVGICGIPSGLAAAKRPEQDSVVRGSNRFACELYAQLRTKPGNLCFSPYSIVTALAMTHAGARGQTAQQMADVLHFEFSQEQLHHAMQLWLADLRMSSESPQGCEIYSANALWGQQGYGFLKAFLKLLNSYYGGGLREVDFAAALEDARNTINAWVEEQTRGKIAEFFQPGTLDSSSRLVLINALYFKGQWALPFQKDRTMDAPFTLLSGEQIQVPMMFQIAKVAYGEDETVQVLALPYAGERLAMIFLLPKQVAQLPALETQLSEAYLAEQLMRLQEEKVTIGIPKFTIGSGFSLPGALKALGMSDAFTLPPADFSGMTGKQNLCISEVLHKAFVEVNEAGTEAAAATAVTMMRGGMMEMPSFQADHPFLFVIRDNRSGTLLFVGRVVDPRG